ncbi:hypothetical protein ACE6H2_005590 [Prunus campanulata]
MQESEVRRSTTTLWKAWTQYLKVGWAKVLSQFSSIETPTEPPLFFSNFTEPVNHTHEILSFLGGHFFIRRKHMRKLTAFALRKLFMYTLKGSPKFLTKL